MRLIDATALRIALCELAKLRSGSPIAKGLITAIEAVHDAPTIEAEPVRHGRWDYKAWSDFARITTSGEVVCSNCSARLFRVVGEWFIYCPICGAKMDGGADT